MVTHFNRDAPEKNLPDAYAKTAESNNARLLRIERDAVSMLRDTLQEIDDSLDIDLAYGSTLDRYGEMYGQSRGKATDEQYRILIKNRIARNFCKGDFNSLLSALCVTFNCSSTDLRLVEPEAPCRLRVEALPIAKLNESNIDIETATQIIQSLLPVGVALESINFTGTFEFSGGTTLVYDPATGFADAEQTIGGYFGLLSGSAEGAGTGAVSTAQTAMLGVGILGQMILGTSA